jgi:hypothetical protein
MRQVSLIRLALSLTFLVGTAGACWSETVDVKYRGPVDLSHLSCNAVSRSSFINRVCYDQANAYMIVLLKQTYYHYCGIDKVTVDSFKAADSMGRFYNAYIKGHFDCRVGRVPAY